MEECMSCLGPVVTTEAHLAYAGSRIHSNNTAEMSAIFEALSFLGPCGLVARDACSCIFNSKHVAGVCLGTIHARTHVQLGLSVIAGGPAQATFHRAARLQSRGKHWKRMRWRRTKTFPHVGRVIHVILIHALLPATTLVMSWKSYVTLAQRACLPPNARPEVSVLFHAVFRCGLSCVYHRLLGRFSFIRLAQSYLVSLVEGCGVQWKGQTPRLFLPLRTLLASMRTTFGIQ